LVQIPFGDPEDVFHVPGGVIVVPQGLFQILLSSVIPQVPGRRVGGILHIPGIGFPVAVSVDAIGFPGRGQKLKGADRTLARDHVFPLRIPRAGGLAEIGFPLVDGGEDIPRDPVFRSRFLIDVQKFGGNLF